MSRSPRELPHVSFLQGDIQYTQEGPIDPHVNSDSIGALPLSSGHALRTPCSPPFTPPNLIPSDPYKPDNQTFPFTPFTPTFSPSLEVNDEHPFGSSFAQNTIPGCSYSHELDPYAVPFVPTQIANTQNNHRSIPRPTPPPLVLTPTRLPRLHHGARSDRILTKTLNITDAQLYSQHFPPGHLLNRAFVLKYAPGAQIGLGAFGFVITGRHRRLGYEVAVKFIQINKVPRWGWSDDPDLGRVPTEAALLKLLDHPGIIKFLDLFQDQEYFYLVQELHGSPWRGKEQADVPFQRRKGSSAPGAFDAALLLSHPLESESATLSQSLDYSRHTASSLCFQDLCGGSELTMPSYPPAASPSFSSPPCSPVTPVTPSSPVTPLLGVRPRRQSHDLFECIEEHQCLSEFQARYIFAQVVDAVHYLDSVGVAHRDIKDENVLIDRDFRVKLIDFGAASCVDIQTGPRPWYRHFRGTVAYAPAEVIRNVKYHRAEPADVWALGVLLSYLITGRSAFPTAAEAAQGRIHLQKCRVRAKGEPPPLLHQENTVSAECWDLLTRCLDPDPSRRAPIAEIKAHVWLEGALDKA